MSVTISVTPYRVASVLRDAADLLEAEGWHPEANSMLHAIDRAANYVPGRGTPDAEATSFAAWDALCTHLDDLWPTPWELEREQAEVVAALRGAAGAVGAS